MGQRVGLPPQLGQCTQHPPRPSPAPHMCRIRSLPLNSVFPVIISAMMQPADQMSTETEAPCQCSVGQGGQDMRGEGHRHSGSPAFHPLPGSHSRTAAPHEEPPWGFP